MRTMYCMACLLLARGPGRFPGTLPRRASLAEIDIGPRRTTNHRAGGGNASVFPGEVLQPGAVDPGTRCTLQKGHGDEARAARPPPHHGFPAPTAVRPVPLLRARPVRGPDSPGAAVDRGREWTARRKRLPMRASCGAPPRRRAERRVHRDAAGGRGGRGLPPGPRGPGAHRRATPVGTDAAAPPPRAELEPPTGSVAAPPVRCPEVVRRNEGADRTSVAL